MEFSEQYRDLKDELLLRIVEDPESHQPAAVEAAQAELASRGIEVAIPPPPTRDQLDDRARRLLDRADSNKRWGVVLLGLGLLLTIGSYVSSAGGVVYVWYGAIIVGLVKIFRGLSQVDEARRLQNNENSSERPLS